jgi:hypothetical protein
MKVVFLKPHLDWNPGQEVEMDDGIAAYLIKTGVATNEEADPEEIEKTLHKKLKASPHPLKGSKGKNFKK